MATTQRKNGFQKGHKDFVSKESRKKQSDKMKGRIPKNWTKFLGFKNGHNFKGFMGKNHSIETKMAISAKKQGVSITDWVCFLTLIYPQIRNSKKYSIWRTSVFERDNYTCIWCNQSKSNRLNADHIKPFSLILKQNNILNFEDALACEELWDINNGRTLCVDCHKLTETYGGKQN